MATTCLRAAWLGTLSSKLGRKPVLRFHPVRDATAEQIDAVTLKRLIETPLHASGKVTIVAPLDEAHRARNTRREDAAHGAKPGTSKSDAAAQREQQELAADAIMRVVVEKRDHEDPAGKGPVTYTVSLRIFSVGASPILYCVARHRITKR